MIDEKTLEERQRLRAELKESHTPQAISERLRGGAAQSYLRDFIYGAIDGSVTTFAVVSGVVGADLSPGIVIIMGVANLLADGFSMAASNFLGTRAEHQEQEHARATEHQHIHAMPEGEREEIRQILAGKGFTGDDLERAVEIITSDTERWVEMMLREEHGLATQVRSPWRASLLTFLAFVLFGAIPLAPFLFQLVTRSSPDFNLKLSTAMTAVAFFAVGAFKSRFVQQHWSIAGLETLAVGGGAAALAYGVGLLLRGLGTDAG